MEPVYIALIINSSNEPDLSQYDLVINLFNSEFPNNNLIVERYFINGSIASIDASLDDFISKYPVGNRITISITTTILKECSEYFIRNNLDILSISINATSNEIKTYNNVITYTPLNQYAIMSIFMAYVDYQMDHLHILYDNTTTNIGLTDLFNQVIIQAGLLNIPVTISYLQEGKYSYNILPKSLIIMLALTNDITTKYVTPQFLHNIPPHCFITLTTANTKMTDIFGKIPAIVVCPIPINYTKTTELVYNTVKNNPTGFDYTSYAFYDVIFVINALSVNNLPITKINFITINPYNIISPAWLLNSSIINNINSAPYGNYAMIFTKNIIINKDQDLFIRYYRGGQGSLPDSYSIFRITGITYDNQSLINYNDANFYEIYDKCNNKIVVKFNSDVTTFPPEINMNYLNVGTSIQTKFIYEFNPAGYFIVLERLFPYYGQIPQVNSTMSKVPIKLKYYR
jgi:hypothetical protein